MIFSENRFPLFGIMLFPAHDLFRKPVPTFRDHAFPRRMIFPENRFPLFGIMRYSSGGSVRSQATMASMSASFIFLK